MNLQGLPDITVNQILCRTCGTVTGNRRFCSAPCAARHVASARALRGELPVRKTDGRVEYVALPKVGVREERVLTIEADPASLRTCGELLRRVLGFLRGPPPGMSRLEAQRHAALLRELLAHEGPRTGPAADEPIVQLGRVARRWLDGFLEPGRSGLQVSYALDTLELLRLVAFGQRSYGRELTIRGLLPPNEAAAREFRWLDTPQHKKDMTESFVRGTVVQAVLPAGIPSTRFYDGVRPGGTVAVFLQRCHRCPPLVHDAVDVELDFEPAPFQWTRFVFDSHVLMKVGESGRLRAWQPGEALGSERWGAEGSYQPGTDLRVKLPAAWITHEIDVGGTFDFEAAKLLTLPEWAQAS